MQHNVTLKESRVVFTSDPHSYHLGDKELKGVTGILSRHLFKSKYLGVATDVLNAAAERGSRIHENCRAYDMLGFIANEEVQAYADIKEELGLTTIANEYTVSDEKNVASNIDGVYLREGKIVLGDYKTTSHLDIEYLSWQLSIYKYLFELQNPGYIVDGLLGIWLPLSRYGKPKASWVKEIPREEIIRLLECDANGVEYTTLPTTVPPEVMMIQERLYDVAVRIKEAKEEDERLHAALLQAMEENDVKKWETEKFVCTRILPSKTKRFNSSAFRRDHPELYDEYISETDTKGSVKITIKKDKK